MTSDDLGLPRITSDCIQLPRIASDCLGLPLIVARIASDCLGLPLMVASDWPRIASDCCLGLLPRIAADFQSDFLLMAGLARLLLPSHAVRRCEAVYDNLARGDLRAGPRGDEI